ncbi:hypothetical protein K1719_028172 [Acacia pycnantha]|nr:hypothetical protein K1719_028172 [Acacia pycnantha]
MFPIWATGIVLSAVYAKMSTMFVEQGTMMDTSINSFTIPAASLSTFDVLKVLFSGSPSTTGSSFQSRGNLQARKGASQSAKDDLQDQALTTATDDEAIGLEHVQILHGCCDGQVAIQRKTEKKRP